MPDLLSSFFDAVDLVEELRPFVRLAVAGRKRRTKEMFTNKAHYEVFKHLRRRPFEVRMSRRYVLLRYDWNVMDRTRVTNYVVGVNSDGKLFINKLFFPPAHRSSLGEHLGVKVTASYDCDFMEVMGFDCDLEVSPVKSIPAPAPDGGWHAARYRLQGDLVLFAQPVGDVRSVYRAVVEERATEFVTRELSNMLIDRISLVLAAHSISARRRRGRSGDMLIVEAVPYRSSEEERERAVRKLFKLIERELYYDDVARGVVMAGQADCAESARIYIGQTRDSTTSQYLAYAIEARPSSTAILRSVREVVNGLDLRAGRRVVHFGRHKVVIAHAYPSRFTAAVRLPVHDPEGLEEPRLFHFEEPRLYVEPGGEVEVHHPEHGVAKYDVVKGLEASLASVSVDPIFDLRLSHYSLKHL